MYREVLFGELTIYEKRLTCQMSHVMVGPMDHLASNAGTDKTYRNKYMEKACAKCTKPLVDAKGFQTDVWRCGNHECGSVIHIKCIYKFIRNQVDTSNSDRIGCPICSTDISRKDRERIMFIYIDMLEKQVSDLTELCEDLAAQFHASETARRASETERLADRVRNCSSFITILYKSPPFCHAF